MNWSIAWLLFHGGPSTQPGWHGHFELHGVIRKYSLMKRAFQNIGPVVCNIGRVVRMLLFQAWLCEVRQAEPAAISTEPVVRPQLLIVPNDQNALKFQGVPYDHVDDWSTLAQLMAVHSKTSSINPAHSPVILHTAVLETHSPVDGTQPCNVV